MMFWFYSHDAAHCILSVHYRTGDEHYSKLLTRSKNSVLTHLNVRECGLRDECLGALFGANRTYICPLVSLNLAYNPLEQRGFATVLRFLKSTPMLRILKVESTRIGDEGVRLLAGALGHVRIDELNLNFTNIGDEGLQCLLASEGAGRLVKLDLRGNNFTRAGFESTCQFLQQDDNRIRKLTIISCDGQRNFDLSSAQRMIDSISCKSKLKDFNFGCSGRYEIYGLAENLKKQICNTTSFETLLRSNHYLRWASDNDSSLDELDGVFEAERNPVKKAFRINSRSRYGAPFIKRLRHKLRTFYFTGQFDIQPFVDLHISLIPHLLELVTMTEVCVNPDSNILGSGEYYKARSQDLDAAYHMLRNMHSLPELFTFPFPGSVTKQLEIKNKQLEAEVAALRARNDELQKENEELKAESNGLPNKRTKPST